MLATRWASSERSVRTLAIAARFSLMAASVKLHNVSCMPPSISVAVMNRTDDPVPVTHGRPVALPQSTESRYPGDMGPGNSGRSTGSKIRAGSLDRVGRQAPGVSPG